MPSTPTPWRTGDGKNAPTSPRVILEGDRYIGETKHPDDATYIVQAVNAYDRLQAENAKMREAVETAKGCTWHLLETWRARAKDFPFIREEVLPGIEESYRKIESALLP